MKQKPRTQDIVLTLNTKNIIEHDNLVRLVECFTSKLRIRKILSSLYVKSRNLSIEPIVMLKIIIYAYMKCILSKFTDFLFSINEINFENLFVDGAKIEAYANKYTFVWRKTIEKFKKDLKEKLFNGRNSFSKTDIDVTFMRMKENHMKNGQLKPAYNIQIGVEAEYITNLIITQNRNDLNTLIPLLEKFPKHQKYKNIIADSGYESLENYDYLDRNNYNSYIKPLNYEISKKRKFKTFIGKVENMQYN